MRKPRVDYGLDAPGVFRGLLIGGLAAAIIGFFLVRWALSRHVGFAIGMAFMVQNSGIGCNRSKIGHRKTMIAMHSIPAECAPAPLRSS